MLHDNKISEDPRSHPRQERFRFFPANEDYLLATARNVELNPVRARLVKWPRAWRWSSARAHLTGKDDRLVQIAPLLERISEWATFLAGGTEEEDVEQISKHSRTGPGPSMTTDAAEKYTVPGTLPCW